MVSSGPRPVQDPDVELFYGKAVDVGASDSDDDDDARTLDAATINRVLRRASKPLAACMRKGTAKTARVDFAIRGSDGSVTSVLVNDKRSGSLQRCVGRALQRLEFPRFEASTAKAGLQMSR